MARLTVSAHFVTAALAGAARDGFDTDAMLRDADIEPALIHDEQARVTVERYGLGAFRKLQETDLGTSTATGEKEQTPEQLARQINARLEPWVFIVPEQAYAAVDLRREDLVRKK